MLKEKSYKDVAEIYDIVELGGDGETALTNALIVQHLRDNRARRVLDMACGTGAQTIALHRAGFEVMASDLSESMLEVARRKSQNLGIAFHKANMIDVALGTFDAIIAINNAVGHLTPGEFRRSLRNASEHLDSGGLMIFDIFDAPVMSYLPHRPVIDVALSYGTAKYVRYSSFAFDGLTSILTINQTTHIQDHFDPFQTIEESYQLQTYSKTELKRIVLENGFSRALITGEGMPELRSDASMANLAVCYK